jgi:hypothetical protein
MGDQRNLTLAALMPDVGRRISPVARRFIGHSTKPIPLLYLFRWPKKAQNYKKRLKLCKYVYLYCSRFFHGIHFSKIKFLTHHQDTPRIPHLLRITSFTLNGASIVHLRPYFNIDAKFPSCSLRNICK